MPEPDRMVGLDELFEAGPAPRERLKPDAFTGRWWVRTGFIALGLAAALFVVLYVVRLGIPFPLIAVTVLAILVLRAALQLVADEPLPTEVTGAGIEPVKPDEFAGPLEGLRFSVTATDGLRFAISRWDDRLVWGDRDASRFGSIVVPRIGELVDERLRQRHGITRASSPARARELLGDEAWAFLHAPLSHGYGPRDVASIIAKVEAL
jgi:hypothetical protein